MISKRVALAAFAGIAASAPAQADVTISTATTHHIKCSGGLCVPTGNKAVLSVNDLESLLKSGNVKVTTTGSGVQADNIRVLTKLNWSSANTLSFDAYQSVEILKPISIGGRSGISLVTNDGGSNGSLRFKGAGRIAIKKLSTALSVNGTKYALVNTVSGLATEIANNPYVAVAFANSYDASADGTYSTSPVPTTFQGRFEGLGNTISNLSINDSTDRSVALFANTQTNAVISDIRLSNVAVTARATDATAAALVVNLNEATVSGAFASGTVSGAEEGSGLVGYNNMGDVDYSSTSVTVSGGMYAAGLVDGNGGTIAYCVATGSVSTTGSSKISDSGGLAATNGGYISQSFASGAVSGAGWVGGLVGYNAVSIDYRGDVENSYATGSVKASSSAAGAGGLIGKNDPEGGAAISYSTGYVTGGGYLGGFVAADYSSGTLKANYWDTDTSGISNLSQGAGYPSNDSGITGKSTSQLQSGLPSGFDPAIWAEDSSINNGLPYLINNPPPK